MNVLLEMHFQIKTEGKIPGSSLPLSLSPSPSQDVKICLTGLQWVGIEEAAVNQVRKALRTKPLSRQLLLPITSIIPL
ncbi:MAG: hypothetical protein U7123_22730 [Potamolinea sp.]